MLAVTILAVFSGIALGADASGTGTAPATRTPHFALVAMLVALSVAVVMGLWKRGVIGPRKATPANEARDASPLPVVAWFAFFIGTYCFVMLLGALLMNLPEGSDPLRRRALASLGGSLGGAIAAGVLAWLALGLARRSGLSARVRDVPRGLLAFAICVPILLATSMLSTLVASWVRGSPPDAAGHPLLKSFRDDPGNPWIWTMLASAVLVTPVFEELLYRGFLQSAFLRALASPSASIACASTLFAAMHVVGGEGSRVDWHSLPTLLVLGVCMGVAFERTKSIGVPIVMHMAFNAANVALMAGSL